MQRPTSVTVFGILNIVLGLLGTIASAAFPFLPQAENGAVPGLNVNVHPAVQIYQDVSLKLGFVASIVMLVSGIGLLMLQPWARKLCLVYAAYAVVATIVGTVVTISIFLPLLRPAQEENPAVAAGLVGGIIGAVIGSLIGCIYPFLLWHYMRRPHVLVATGELPAEVVDDATLVPAVAVTTGAAPSTNPFAPPVRGGSAEGSSVSAVDRLIPSKNGAALSSYYLGLFSLFPVFGLPLAIAAIVLALRGLKKYREDPNVHGSTHAKVGLICGVVFGLFNLLLVFAILFTIIASLVPSSGQPAA
ncbi:MAG: hypothetical protein O2931_08430 [Planctomycetota bacterium]|nr:hypothetical protein [Planctomycetota bacterium]MDA1178806.1 hypothetical protein [Planctomycetota bacterium]